MVATGAAFVPGALSDPDGETKMPYAVSMTHRASCGVDAALQDEASAPPSPPAVPVSAPPSAWLSGEPPSGVVHSGVPGAQ
jgi:hypothetical protein